MLLRLLAGILAVVGVTSCGGAVPAASTSPGGDEPASVASVGAGEGQPAGSLLLRSPERPEHALAKVPVSSADPQWGNVDAPVTIVELSDLQCPFCARVVPTLRRLQQLYGPEQLRIVWKHNPLPFHEQARPAHEVAAAVYMLAGATAFFQFRDRVFQSQQELSKQNLVSWAADSGVNRAALEAWLASGKPAAKVDEDLQLARGIGATGTPAFRINGVTLTGAQPLDQFQAIIDEQLAEARKLTGAGTPAQAVYPLLTAKNFQQPRPPSAAAGAAEEPDTKVWQIPVLADDPQRGPKDALVTIVQFSEFQCPFCKRVEPTLAKLRELHPNDLRIVWKDNALPFHARAMPAAIFARFAYKRRGNEAFWKLHEALFEKQPALEDQDFEELAKAQGLVWAQVQAELASPRARARIEESMELAADFEARGTPHFFINGRRLSGAQPLDEFTKLVDEELAKARALTEGGVPRSKVYAELMKGAEGPRAPERKQVPLLSDAPSRGNPKAPVVIQIFSDFQCPFCKRVEPTLAELERELKGQIRLVWRHLPLAFHHDAQPAAEAAEEVRAQRGDAAFWKYRDLLFEAQGESDGLGRENLVALALTLGVDPVRFEAALDNGVHAARVTGDATIANASGINGTPAFLINDYYLSGAQPVTAFRKLIKLALKDRRHP